jgi:hypothetical protein
MQTIQWQDIASAPPERDLELSVIDAEGVHALVFPCRLHEHAWLDSRTGRRVDIQPTHWRIWAANGFRAKNH